MNAGSGLLTIGGGTHGLNILIGANKELVVAAMSADISLLNIIKDNVGGASALTKSGPNKLTLSGVNTYTGPTTITGGTLAYGGSNIIGTGAVTVSGSTAILDLGASRTDSVGTVTVEGGGSITGTGTSALTSTGTFEMKSGSVTAILAGASSALNKTTSGTVILSGANSYGGGTTISAGTLQLNGGNLGSGAVTGSGSFVTTVATTNSQDWSGFTGTYTHNSTTVSSQFNVATSTSANAAYVIASDQGSTQGMIAAGNGDYTLQLGSLSGVANSMFRGGNSATGTTTLEVGNLGTNTEFQGIIQNGVTKTMALTKVGNGSLTLSGANTYIGATNVSAGTLLVNGSLGNTAVSVTGGTLGGSGAITGTVSVASGAKLSAGNSIESLATGALTMASGSTYVFEAANNTSTGADLVAVNGTLSLAGVTLSLDAATIAALTGGSWTGGDKLTLLSYLDGGSGITSGFTGYADDTSYFFGSNEWKFNYNDTVTGGNYGADAVAAGQNRFVTFTLVPEPSAALLAGLGVLGLLRRRRNA